LLVKLGSLVVHIEEAMSSKGHHFDIATIKGQLQDEELREWLKAMDNG